MSKQVVWRAVVVAILSAVVSGGCSCERTVPKTTVKGSVTLDGRPLAEGDIIFKTPETAAIDSLKITGGQFSGQAEIGKRNVEVYAYKTIQMDPSSPGFDPAGIKQNIIPEKYNARTSLTADVVQGGENNFTFPVTSQ